MIRTRAVLSAVATYLPPTQITNDELARSWPDWSGERVRRATGIRIRSVATDRECASDLGVAAATRLLSIGTHRASDIDFLLFCTQTPDYVIPSSACIMRHRLGLPTRCGAFDINQGCSGFIYALATAKGLAGELWRPEPPIVRGRLSPDLGPVRRHDRHGNPRLHL